MRMRKNLYRVCIFFLFGLVSLVSNTAAAQNGGPLSIEIDLKDYIEARHFSPEQKRNIRQTGELSGMGEVEYEFKVPVSGWYRLYAVAGMNSVKFYLDDEFIIYTCFHNPAWPREGRKPVKVINLYLEEGVHRLKLSRMWHWGFGRVQRIFFEPAEDVTGMVRLKFLKDYFVFRRGESFPAMLLAGMGTDPHQISLVYHDARTGEVMKTEDRTIPAGEGVHQSKINLSTDRPGAFIVHIKDQQGRHVARVFQYMVIDTANQPPAPPRLKTELVQTIDCVETKPDYVHGGDTRVAEGPAGSCRESGAMGNVEHGEQASWFAYTLQLPKVQEPYLLEIEYPDDDERTFTYSIIQPDMPGGRAFTHGVASGGMYELTGKMQKRSMLFYPIDTNPRVQLRTWWTGQRAAASKIRVYRIVSGFPRNLAEKEAGGRLFGRYQEEPCRFVQWGARPDEGDTWQNLWDAANRIGQYSRYVGCDFWKPTVAIYGAKMWPSQFIPELDEDAGSWAIGGPHHDLDPRPKDLIRLLLLTCEKYNMRFVGELFDKSLRAYMRRFLSMRFGAGDSEFKNPTEHPWLLVDKDGKAKGGIRYNPLHPSVQSWRADIVRELANRYSDSPAFKGVALRYMGWQFPAWQGFPSIDWGYGDWTIHKFEEETDVDVPVNDDDPNRYRKRYDWLMANAYQEWVNWRSARLTAYLNELASILRDARSDLKLRLDLHGPTYGDEPDAEAYRLKGWEGLLRETGLDPERLRKNPDIVMVEGRVYPPGIRGAGTKEPVERGERIFTNFDGAATRDLASPLGEGSINAAHIDANSFESNIARMKDLGYEGLKGRGNRPAEIHGAGLVFPAGRHSLRRYATAMASGNITEFTDGSHGYICWPTEHLKEWMLEYQALPDIGMKKLDGSGDPVAVWYGMKKGNTFLYAVNTSPWKASVSITLPAGASLARLTTGEELLSGEDGKMRFSLEAYELRGFRAGASPTGMNADIPKEVKNKLHKQLDFIDGLLSGEFGGGGSGVFPISPVELRHAGERLAEAREAFEKGHYWRVRLLTLHWDLLRLYDAFNAWPEGVWDRRLPVEPEGAMNAETLRQRISGRRSEASVLTGSSIHPWLGGSKVLQITEPVDVKVSLPVYNRYQLRYACVLADHDWPGLKIDEKEIPQTSVSEKKTDILAIQTMSPPLSLRKGEHTLNIRPGRKPAGILWAYFQPVFRPLRANDWLVLGSFDSEWENPGPPKLDLKLPPDAGAINFDETYTGKDGKEIGWQRPESESEYIDLYKVTTDYSFVLGYAVTHIISPEKRLAEFHFGVDYWAQVFLNNEKVYEAAEGHGAPTAGQFRFTAELREGINELKIKVHAGSRGNGFWLGVSDPGDLEVRVPDMDRNPLMPTRENLIGDKSSGV